MYTVPTDAFAPRSAEGFFRHRLASTVRREVAAEEIYSRDEIAKITGH